MLPPGPAAVPCMVSLRLPEPPTIIDSDFRSRLPSDGIARDGPPIPGQSATAVGFFSFREHSGPASRRGPPLARHPIPAPGVNEQASTGSRSCPLGYGPAKAPRPPRVRGLPVIGNTPQLLRRPWELLQSSYRAHGPAFRISIFGTEAVVLAGPAVRELYLEAGDNLLDRAFFYERLELELAATELIFRTKGERHRELRRSASLALSRHVAAEHVPAAAAEMVRYFESLVPGRSYDGLELASQVLLSAAGPMLGEYDLRPHLREVGAYISRMMEVASGTRTRLAVWSPRYRRARRLSLQIGRRLLERWRLGEIGDGSGSYIIGCFAEARDPRGAPLPDADLVSLAALTFVGVGVYISRVAAFMLYELCRDHDLRARVVAEVEAAFADGYTYEGLRDMTLLRAVYCEALRRYPIWFVVPFRAEQEFEFSGKRIRRGDILLISAVQEHFFPEYYPDPERFEPDRCLPPRNEHLRHGAFSPFGRGGRRCIAAGQTEIMSLLFAAVLLHRTRLRADPGYELAVRLKPLPGPHRFRLRFEGMRELTAPPAPRARPAPSGAETVDDIGVRLDWEETAIFQAIADREMDVRVFPGGTVVFRQDDEPDAFYIIESGEAVVLKRTEAGGEETLATIGAGDVFGELGLLRRQPRLATVVAAPGPDHLVTLKCSADAFERLLGALNITGEELIALIRRRKVAASLARLVPAMERPAIRALLADARFRRGRNREVFVREGDPSDSFHVIERGAFEVVREILPGAERVIARLEKGEFFGEMGLLRDAPRTATVRVASDCDDAETLVLGKDAFLRLIEPEAKFRERVFAELAGRLHEG